MSERRRFGVLPRSLTGQVVLLVIAALAFAQAVSFVALWDERRSALATAIRDQVAFGIATTVRQLQVIPPELQNELLAATSRHRFDLSIDDMPTLAESTLDPREERLVQRLRAVLGRLGATDVRVAIGPPPPPPEWLRRRRQEMIDRGERPPPPGSAQQLGMTVSLRLPEIRGRFDGATGASTDAPPRWLNGTAIVRVPPPAWASAALIGLAITAVALTLIVVMSVRRINRPLSELVFATVRLGRGETLEPLPETGPEDMRRVTRAFNRMQERLTRANRDRARVLGAIAHDLRTPLTSLKLRIEFVDDEEIRNRLIDTTEEMRRIVEAGLAFAREGGDVEATETVDLACLVAEISEELADLGADVEAPSHEPVEIACRPASLRRALRNLIENGVLYGKRAIVTVGADADTATVHIDDEGPGLAEEDFERVFEPFERLDASRSRETGGTGLGLAITRAIARGHGGDVTFANRAEGGLRATLALPRHSPAG